ncbi:nucleotidyltransferase domain-containing protein [Kineococcus siccus]|uniref:nucleotidyltransferase domain-containing protein n=1 Tax=Kineococcus siccus TaxID=2696567 RepID=UPI00196A9954|nr:nucleotidyltransferase domain-containing protein [Kineococcus siccus]
MFTTDERTRLRRHLVARAEADPQVLAAAVVGSAARDREDRWSDIDLAFSVGPGRRPEDVADDWTGHLYADHHAVAHVDVWSGAALYRVFLLQNTLQVDLSFWPAEAFSPVGGPFRLLFGDAGPAVPATPRDTGALLGTTWLYALHARSSIARGRALQALHMLNGMRDQLVVLACVRAGLPADQGRGVDDLPADLRRRLTSTVARRLDAPELTRSFRELADLLVEEAAIADPGAAAVLAPVVTEMVRSAEDEPTEEG